MSHSKYKRTPRGTKFVKLERWMTNSPAWRSLSPAARAAYIEFGETYDGCNNGYLGRALSSSSSSGGSWSVWRTFMGCSCVRERSCQPV